MTTLINNYKHHTIDQNGVITNQKTGNVKSQWEAKSGYLCVDIQENGKASKHYLHRLLAQTFIPNPDNKRTVNHIDGNKLNNSLTNLEWSTDSENIKHAYNNGLNRSNKLIHDDDYANILDKFFCGNSLTSIVKDYPFSLTTFSTYVVAYVKENGLYDKYIEEKQRQKKKRNTNATHTTHAVVRIDKTESGDEVIFDSLGDAARALGKTSSGPISNVLAGRAKSAYGYFWRRV